MSERIFIEVSARHIHLSKTDVAKLFGEGYILTKKKDLFQPGEYSCEERITIVGPKRSLENVSVLGPERKDTQIEISATDARSTGINAPIRESGDVLGSGSCKLIGPAGELELSEGVIVAKRHIHMTPEDARFFKISNHQIVKVSIKTEKRSLIYDDVVARVSPNYALALHIDTDEGNAAGLSSLDSYCTIVT